MARMSKGKGVRREPRQFPAEFKAGAVRLVLEEGKTGAADFGALGGVQLHLE